MKADQIEVIDAELTDEQVQRNEEVFKQLVNISRETSGEDISAEEEAFLVEQANIATTKLDIFGLYVLASMLMYCARAGAASVLANVDEGDEVPEQDGAPAESEAVEGDGSAVAWPESVTAKQEDEQAI